MRTILFTICLCLLSCSQPQSQSSPDTAALSAAPISKILSPKEFTNLLSQKENAYLLDVRTPEEVNAGTLKGAIPINFYDADFESKIAALDRNRPVFVYCKSGGRSGKSAKIMEKLGFTEIYDVDGGYSDLAQ